MNKIRATLIGAICALSISNSYASNITMTWTKSGVLLAGASWNKYSAAGTYADGSYRLMGTVRYGGHEYPIQAKLSRTGSTVSTWIYPDLKDKTVPCYTDLGNDRYVFANITLSNGHAGVGIYKLDASGAGTTSLIAEVEGTTYNGTESVLGAYHDSTNNFYIYGKAQDSATTETAFISKVSSPGVVQWTTQIGSSSLVLSAGVDSVGSTFLMGRDTDVFAKSLNSGGIQQFSTSYGYSPVTSQSSLVSADSIRGGVWVANGCFTGTDTFIDVRHATSTGLSTSGFFGHVGYDLSYSPDQLIPNVSGALLGSSGLSGGIASASVAQLDELGNQMWAANLGNVTTGSPQMKVTGMFLDSYREAYVTVYRNDGTTHLMKYSTTGTLRWDVAITAPGANYVQSAAIHAGSGDIVLTSYTWDGTSTGTFNCSNYKQSAVAINDGYRLRKNHTYSSSTAVTANDRHAGGAVIHLTAQAQHGTVTLLSSGQFKYVPDTNFVGVDSFTYSLTKPNLDTGTGKATLTVLN